MHNCTISCCEQKLDDMNRLFSFGKSIKFKKSSSLSSAAKMRVRRVTLFRTANEKKIEEK